jgi:hypothetical protein
VSAFLLTIIDLFLLIVILKSLSVKMILYHSKLVFFVDCFQEKFWVNHEMKWKVQSCVPSHPSTAQPPHPPSSVTNIPAATVQRSTFVTIGEPRSTSPRVHSLGMGVSLGVVHSVVWTMM